MNDQVLVLNASYEPLAAVGVRRALNLLVSGKASAIEGTGHFVNSEDDQYEIPYVVLLNHYVNRTHRDRVAFSKKSVLARDKYTCAYCGKYANTIDHVVPRALGGGNSYTNCVASCKKCNSKKGSKTLEQMGWELPFTPKAPNRHTMLFNKVSHRSPAVKIWAPYIESYGG